MIKRLYIVYSICLIYHSKIFINVADERSNDYRVKQTR